MPMRFSLSTALLLVTIVSLAMALWLEWTREPDVLYLHLYSNRYDIHSMGDAPPPPRNWQCIATISVVSGASFYANIPCHYEPAMSLVGTFDRHGDMVRTQISIDVADVGPAFRHEEDSLIPLNRLQTFGDGEFKYSISDDSDGSALIAD